jgi:two-component system LytT family sensor kinase
MNVTQPNKDFYKYFRFIFVPIVFLGFYLLAFLVDPFRNWADYFNRSVTQLLVEWAFVLLFCLIITEINLILARKLDKSLPWVMYPLQRFFTQFIVQIISTTLFLYIFLRTSIYIFEGDSGLSNVDHLKLRQMFVVSLLLSTLISLIYTGNFFLQKWKDAVLETAELNVKTVELKQIALEAQLESLKAQLDPHFMFNNFSTLSALIAEDAALAQHFLENLSRVYRYMIINLNKNIITVEEEINFAQAYFYLIKIRLGDNVMMDIDVSEAILKKGIPPITLQLLIENAIKHNTASRSKPLQINIGMEGNDRLKITNTLQRLNYNIPSTCLGIKNIHSRYLLLSDQDVEIQESADQFIVKLPLLKTCP